MKYRLVYLRLRRAARAASASKLSVAVVGSGIRPVTGIEPFRKCTMVSSPIMEPVKYWLALNSNVSVPENRVILSCAVADAVDSVAHDAFIVQLCLGRDFSGKDNLIALYQSLAANTAFWILR